VCALDGMDGKILTKNKQKNGCRQAQGRWHDGMRDGLWLPRPAPCHHTNTAQSWDEHRQNTSNGSNDTKEGARSKVANSASKPPSPLSFEENGHFSPRRYSLPSEEPSVSNQLFDDEEEENHLNHQGTEDDDDEEDEDEDEDDDNDGEATSEREVSLLLTSARSDHLWRSIRIVARALDGAQSEEDIMERERQKEQAERAWFHPLDPWHQHPHFCPPASNAVYRPAFSPSSGPFVTSSSSSPPLPATWPFSAHQFPRTFYPPHLHHYPSYPPSHMVSLPVQSPTQSSFRQLPSSGGADPTHSNPTSEGASLDILIGAPASHSSPSSRTSYPTNAPPPPMMLHYPLNWHPYASHRPYASLATIPGALPFPSSPPNQASTFDPRGVFPGMPPSRAPELVSPRLHLGSAPAPSPVMTSCTNVVIS